MIQLMLNVSNFFPNCLLNLFCKIEIKKNMAEERTGMKKYTEMDNIYMYVAFIFIVAAD